LNYLLIAQSGIDSFVTFDCLFESYLLFVEQVPNVVSIAGLLWSVPIIVK